MSMLLWVAALGVGAAVLMPKGKKKTYQVLFETKGAYKSPNGEKTELDAAESKLIALLAPQLPAGKWSWSAPGTLMLTTDSPEFYKDKLIPVEEGQLVVRGVSEVG